jgi:sulfite reductase (NADPH) flavoprotein alpha-component
MTEVTAALLPIWHREKPFPALLTQQLRLTAVESAKDVRHLELSLKDSGLVYRPGDTVGVWIRNDPELVYQLLRCIQLDPETRLVIDDAEHTLIYALTNVYEITQVIPGFLKSYASITENHVLTELCKNPVELRSYIEGRQILDVLQEHHDPQKQNNFTAEKFLSCLRRIHPRQYSISSSQLQHPDAVHLCVGQVLYEHDNEVRKGAGSVFLGMRIHVGDEVPVFIISNDNFRLPEDKEAPVIMIGPGTGIAPFRAFLQEREASNANGKNWLIFGNPHQATDFLYKDEIDQWHANRIINELDLAFSRDTTEKQYVQHCLLKKADLLWQWLEAGAFLYICGDARHMAVDVQEVLLKIIATQGKLEPSAAKQYLVKLRQQKRYQRDVY